MITSTRSYKLSFIACNARRMATTSSRASLSHVERTAQEPRDKSLHTVILSQIEEVNDNIRLLRLSLPKENAGIKFLPGQWLDVHIPNLPKPGGFTITSTPSRALALPPSTPSSSPPYLELAIQKSTNPPAAHLWQPIPTILNSTLQIRIGGSFTWPPPTLSQSEIKQVKKVIFVAGGVGINPLISILSHLRELKFQNIDYHREIIFIYSVKDPGEVRNRRNEILFLERVVRCVEDLGGEFLLFLTGGDGNGKGGGEGSVEVEGRMVGFKRRRVGGEDVLGVIGEVEGRGGVVCYVCGVPGMTDEFVELVQGVEGIDRRRVLFERWW